MNKIRHILGGLVIFAMLLGLFVTINNDFETEYNITRENVTIGNATTDINVGEALANLSIISAMDKITAAFDPQKTGDKFDLLGAIALGAIGLVNFLLGILTIPFEIAGIIGQYFSVPSIILQGVVALFYVYVVMILISIRLGKDT